jgi:chromosomal replication initiator protein
VRLATNRARSGQPHRLSEQKQAPAEAHSAITASATEGRDDLMAGLDPRYKFANFVVGKPNELAFAVARRTAESEKVAFNPLFLYGGSWSWQNASYACHCLAYPPAITIAQGTVSVG